WSPAETKGQMKFNQGTCRYEKIVQGLPVNTNYEWKVAFNGDWVGDKGCIGSSNCQFNSGSSGVVLLIYNSYNGELTTRPLTSAETTTLDAPTSTAVPTFDEGRENVGHCVHNDHVIPYCRHLDNKEELELPSYSNYENTYITGINIL
ncbi:unnamed protein product, partial [Rotaria socialis]